MTEKKSTNEEQELEESESMARTKASFTCEELEWLTACLDADLMNDFIDCGIDDKQAYTDYKARVQLINRLNFQKHHRH